MKTATLDGIRFAQMMQGGAANLHSNRQLVNDLNVFPIPDGDTGDNMFMTIDSGVSVLRQHPVDSLGAAASMTAKGMLLGARGNSGVILSRIFAGISRGLEGRDVADAATISRALQVGVEEAYNAVSVPVEGTILTVYKDAVSYAASRLRPDTNLEDYFEDFFGEMQRSLDRTPDLLQVLKDAGVVDSGGAGLVYIAEGMKQGFLRQLADRSPDQAVAAPQAPDLDLFTEDSVLTFGYCTEFLLRLQRAKTDLDRFDLDAFTRYLNEQGDSVVCFRDGSIVKVHVHTREPGRILNHSQQFGEFLTLKIENMTLQHHQSHLQPTPHIAPPRPHKACGIVAVASGKGITDTFSSLGCDAVVDGGQSMNPSTEDFLRAFDQTNADTIFVFPNNSNVILTARQAASLYDKADVRVLPSRTVGEGYAAISVLDTAGEADQIEAELREVIDGVVTGMVSRAVRDTDKNGVEVHTGNYIGFVGDHIYLAGPDREQTAVGLAEQLDAGGYDILLVVCGEATNADETARLHAELSARFKRTEVILIDGGQPIYDYILILE